MDDLIKQKEKIVCKIHENEKNRLLALKEDTLSREKTDYKNPTPRSLLRLLQLPIERPWDDQKHKLLNQLACFGVRNPLIIKSSKTFVVELRDRKTNTVIVHRFYEPTMDYHHELAFSKVATHIQTELLNEKQKTLSWIRLDEYLLPYLMVAYDPRVAICGVAQDLDAYSFPQCSTVGTFEQRFICEIYHGELIYQECFDQFAEKISQSIPFTKPLILIIASYCRSVTLGSPLLDSLFWEQSDNTYRLLLRRWISEHRSRKATKESGESGCQAVHLAARVGDTRALGILFQEDENSDIYNSTDDNGCHAFCYSRSVSVRQFIMNHGGTFCKHHESFG